ncbi:hypothetical protein BN982_03613 [Halobacillus karajensis]|uniref:Uncharacterized protein n=1 Tax=Halobacillus karajensis TaxID=195088 RepID=A0A024P914_9BACI|nr:hypothetical protein BN982_03613 [Halobacillus karajensis]CDQ25323.1 hypothetical protein BN983_03641 [Halobacillus karajensis]CDQ25954.1 hypothetical protein BN981_00161 [Halobacillus karajensis]
MKKGVTEMYIIVRKNNGATETLKKSNSRVKKTFNDFYTAHMLVKKLNSNTLSRMHWEVQQK